MGANTGRGRRAAARFSDCRPPFALFGSTHTPRCRFHLSRHCAAVRPQASAAASTAGCSSGGGPLRCRPMPSAENCAGEPSGLQIALARRCRPLGFSPRISGQNQNHGFQVFNCRCLQSARGRVSQRWRGPRLAIAWRHWRRRARWSDRHAGCCLDGPVGLHHDAALYAK